MVVDGAEVPELCAVYALPPEAWASCASACGDGGAAWTDVPCAVFTVMVPLEVPSETV